MKNKDIYQELVRRRILPEQPVLLHATMSLAEKISEAQPGDVIDLTPMDVSAYCHALDVFDKTVKFVVVDKDTHEVLSEDDRAEGAQTQSALMVIAHPAEVPELRSPTEEDAEKIRDFIALKEHNYVDISELRVLTPTVDPVSSVVWLFPLLEKMGIEVSISGDLTAEKFEAPDLSVLSVDWVSGNCPVQAEGHVNGVSFYYRARGWHQSFETSDGFLMQEPVIGSQFDAGWISEEDARFFISRASASYIRTKSE